MTRPDRTKYAAPRAFLQVVGPILLLVGLILTVVALADFFSAFNNSMNDGMPTKFFLVFIGLPLIAVGGGMTRAGFLHAVTDYASNETADAVTTTVSAARRGWEEGADRGTGESRTEPGRKLFCSSCGQQNDLEAKFCDACGARLHPEA